MLITMVKQFTEEEWAILGQMLHAVQTLQEKLEAKGLETISTLNVGITRASLVFIVKRAGVPLISFCTLDALENQKLVDRELFAKADTLLNTDLDALEVDFLRKRLADLEKRPQDGGACRG